MNFFVLLVKNLIFVLFPISVYKALEVYKMRDFVLKMLLVVSFFLELYFSEYYYFLIFLIIPLSVCYMKKYDTIYLLLILSFVLYLFIIKFPIFIITLILICLLSFIIFKKRYIEYYLFFLSYIASFILFCLNVNIFITMLLVFCNYYISLFINKMLSSNSYVDYENDFKLFMFKFIHEVKNPLAVCKGYLEILKSKDDYDLKKCLLTLDKEINESLLIIDDYLIYGRNNVNFDYLDINLLINDVYNDFKKLENNDVKINFYYDEEEIFVYGDYNKLKQVFVNIIKNSLEAKRDDKTINIDIDFRVIKNNIIINISDDGIGISDLSKIGNINYSTKKNGNGLGINFSNNIIKLHNGDIKYFSNNKGTRVRIMLPINQF